MVDQPKQPLPNAGSTLLRAFLTVINDGESADKLLPTASYQTEIDGDYLKDYHQLFDTPYQPEQCLLSAFYPLAQRAQLNWFWQHTQTRLPGIIHLNNRLQQFHAVQVDKPLVLRVSTPGVQQLAGGAQQISVLTEFMQSGGCVISCESGYLLARGTGAPPRTGPRRMPIKNEAFAEVQIDAELIRRYAFLSGDWNPIHLSHFSARLFGAPTQIAHGMYAAGWWCAQLQKQQGAPLQSLQIDFIKPVTVPSAAINAHLQGREFSWQQGSKLLLRGSYF